ncbi:hypothetical protein LJC21_02835 [Bacteroides sp. OttesenSCG-928-E20]|nr:hypothetical protein [Bacteroides sp. OttesenSCG-928-N06]MDL2299625.1 hypothetical protein [Bacteroides sp. OttesenSCG-928-E20]MDL2305944.1 hypothetical protein [Bacteroides sp. OttesenSCG-928-D19]
MRNISLRFHAAPVPRRMPPFVKGRWPLGRRVGRREAPGGLAGEIPGGLAGETAGGLAGKEAAGGLAASRPAVQPVCYVHYSLHSL